MAMCMHENTNKEHQALPGQWCCYNEQSAGFHAETNQILLSNHAQIWYRMPSVEQTLVM